MAIPVGVKDIIDTWTCRGKRNRADKGRTPRMVAAVVAALRAAAR